MIYERGFEKGWRYSPYQFERLELYTWDSLYDIY